MRVSPKRSGFRPSQINPTERVYGVFLQREGNRRFEEIVATTRDRAVDMAEHSLNLEFDAPPEIPWRATAVTISDRFEVAGRCPRCRTVLFSDDPHEPTAAGPICADGCG